MAPHRLAISDAKESWQGEVTSWQHLVILGSLSAEPESLDELADALRRYLPEHRLFLPSEVSVRNLEGVAGDGQWCLIDLVGRTVVAGGGLELPEPISAFQADPDDEAEGFPIVWLDTPADWLFREADENWQALLSGRASTRTAATPIDARAILFGPALLDHLAEGVLAAGKLETEDEELKRTRAIHASWLMTARADLHGRIPRDLLLAKRDQITRDLEHRSQQWSQQNCPPPSLPAHSAAYLLGGFGTTEVVLYFELVRTLLAHAWELTKERASLTKATLIERLADVREDWMHQPYEGRETPAELIESERRRMPVTGSGFPIDDDCPICQAEASGELGLGFMWFDGHRLELEDEFAFSLTATREEWEREQEEHRCFSEEMDRKMQERETGAAKAGNELGNLGGSAWRTSFVDWDWVSAGGSRRQAFFALGFPLAELTSELKTRGSVDLMRNVNQAYATLCASQDATVAQSAAQELRDWLEKARETHSDLTPQCADLQSHLDEAFAFPEEPPGSGPTRRFF